MDLQFFQGVVAQRDKQWDPNGILPLSFRAAELAGETGEACNIVKKIERANYGLRGSTATREQLAEELGDVLICLALLANAAGIDLESATVAKFNASSIKLGLDARL